MPQHFDASAIPWQPFGDFPHFAFTILQVDMQQRIADVLFRFDAGQQIVLHRHKALNHTFVVQGEHRLYEPDGRLREVRPAGTYTLDAEVGGQHALRSMTIVAATAPLLTGSSPTDNATGVAVDANLSLSFDRNVRPGSGIVSLYRASDDSLVESYNVSTGLGSLTDSNGAPLGHIAFAGNSLTLNPGTDLDAGTLYYIRVDAGAVIDQAGNAYAGIADSTTVDFRTAGGANQAPVIATSGGSTSFIEGADTASTPVVVDAGLTVSDADNTTLAGATVSLTGNFQSGQDVLAFTNVSNTTMGNISASFDSGTGVLTLSSAGATATLAQWQTALRSVTYTNTSDTPATSSRTVSFSVDDGTDSSTAVTRLVTLTAANDSPAITAPASIVEGDSGSTIATFQLTRGDTSTTDTFYWKILGGALHSVDASDFAGGVFPTGSVTFGCTWPNGRPPSTGTGSAARSRAIAPFRP